jgi:hypothetical protein
VKEDIMRKHTSKSHHLYPLCRVAASAVLVSAGWLALVSPVAAQDATDPALQPAPASLGATSNETPVSLATAPTSDESDTKIAAQNTSAVADASAVAADDSVTVADRTSSKKLFVTDPTVTRYELAALDDRVLDHQRGRAVGMIMVAATPDAFRGNSVTLWDEIGPPVQTPQPSDAAHAAQTGNVVTYNRK